MKQVHRRWTYKGNKKEIDTFLENVTHLYVNEVHVRKSGRISKKGVSKRLCASRKAYMTVDGETLFLEAKSGKDGSIVVLRLDKTAQPDTSDM